MASQSMNSMILNAAGRSDVGLVRTLNEDAIGLDGDRGVFVLADGMGGHSAGEVASNTLVSGVMEFLTDNIGSVSGEDEIKNLIQEAIRRSNAAIFELAERDLSKRGMGTTAVALVVSEGRYHVGWVGDSRMYILKGKRLTQVTKDHSKVQMLVDAKIIKPEAALTHPERNIILRACGTAKDVQVDTLSNALKKGDVIMLCTDGICGSALPEEIEAAALGADAPGDVCDNLIRMSHKKGGDDNASVIAIKIVNM